MKKYEEKIQEYNKFIEKKYLKENNIEIFVELSKDVLINQNEKSISYIEFIYHQSRYIQKRWWALQILVLLLLRLFLKDANLKYVQNLLVVGSFVFATLILPEIWKNKKNLSMEIENSTLYSLNQIYLAKITLFSLIDIFLAAIFFFSSIELSMEIFVKNFIIPFNISCCICFRMLCSKNSSFKITIFSLFLWTIAWLLILSSDILYKITILPTWIILMILSGIYFIYCIRKIDEINFSFIKEGCNAIKN